MNHQLEQRVARLEKHIKFYQLSFIGLFISGLALLFMSFDRQKNAVPELLQAKKFQVVDENNRVLVEINKEGGNGQLSTFTPNGRRLVSLITSSGGAGGINTFDKSGDVLFKVTNTDVGGGYLALFNGEGKEVVETGVTTSETGYIRVNNRVGEKMAWITYTQDGGGYFSLSNNGKETFRLSTPEAGARMGIYNGNNVRVAYMGAQDNKDGNITVWSGTGTRTGGLPQ
jgi:hypothetical protein